MKMWGPAFWRGALETALLVAAFVGFGLGWAGLARRDPNPAAGYPAAIVSCESRSASIWLVDGFNLLHTGILRGRDRAEWWTAPRREQLIERVTRFDELGAEIWVVFDGPDAREGEAEDESRVRRIFAPSADDWLVARVKASTDPARLAVVTADRKVADRARHGGAQIVSPRDFLRRCAS